MQPIEGGGATRSGATVGERPGIVSDQPARIAVARLESALDRISGALVRRAEHEAATADLERVRQAERDRAAEAEVLATRRLLPEVRQRLEILIRTLRQAIAEQEDQGMDDGRMAPE